MGETDVSDFDLDFDCVSPGNDGLAVQDFEKLELDCFRPDTFQVMSHQATFNIGTIGHVAHGKSTVVNAISGVRTARFKKEAVKNITIHLGYANAKIFRSRMLPEPECYVAMPSWAPDDTKCPKTGGDMVLVRHVSFIDCPGHDVLMSTMLNGVAIMDAALLLIAANEPFPQSQTKEHLTAVEVQQMKNVVVLQNKIDLVREREARDQFETIRTYFETISGIRDAPIVPISAQRRLNLDVVMEYICKIPLPTRNLRCPAKMILLRSFDVNKPGPIDSLRGGVAGGSLMEGVLVAGQDIEVRPGIVEVSSSGHIKCRPVRTKITSLFSENNSLDFAVPGGLIGVGTSMDPSLARQNKIAGQMIGERDLMPAVFSEIDIDFFMLSTLVGTKYHKSAQPALGHKGAPLRKIEINEMLQVCIGSKTVVGKVVRVRNPLAKLVLTHPICAAQGDKLTLSRMVDRHYRLIGWGKMRRGVMAEIEYFES